MQRLMFAFVAGALVSRSAQAAQPRLYPLIPISQSDREHPGS